MSERRRAVGARGGPVYSVRAWAHRGLQVLWRRAGARLLGRGHAGRRPQIARAIARLRDDLIAHRDIKPDNILLGAGIDGCGAPCAPAIEDDPNALCVVSDFGEMADGQVVPPRRRVCRMVRCAVV